MDRRSPMEAGGRTGELDLVSTTKPAAGLRPYRLSALRPHTGHLTLHLPKTQSPHEGHTQP